MKIFKITKDYLNEKNEYIGPDLSDHDGHIEADEKLGYVRFGSLKAAGYILFKAGLSIKCTVLSSRSRIFAGLCIWKEPSAEEMVIECKRLEKGTVCFGTLITEQKDAA
jgi:hypothetical protein